MSVKKFVPAGSTFSFHRAAFGRSSLVKELCAENDDDRAAPIGDRIAKECAKVRFRIEKAVANYPASKQNDRDNAKRVATNRSVTPMVALHYSPYTQLRIMSEAGRLYMVGEARKCGQ